MAKKQILIGVDPGVHTGFALYDGESLSLDTCSITRAMQKIFILMQDDNCALHIFIEDARKRQWLGNSGREKLMGAGSIMRDSRIWEDFCNEQNIAYTLVPPKYNRTKLSAEQFGKITKYKGRTSEHARDAAMLVYGRNPKEILCAPQTDLELLQEILNR